jgi:hypothetical protein
VFDFADMSIPLYVGALQHGRREGEIILHVDVGCPHLAARQPRSPPPLAATKKQRLDTRARLCTLCDPDRPKRRRAARRATPTPKKDDSPLTLEEWRARQND